MGRERRARFGVRYCPPQIQIRIGRAYLGGPVVAVVEANLMSPDWGVIGPETIGRPIQNWMRKFPA